MNVPIKTEQHPKTFRVDWIPEADGRKLVRQFAWLVNEYKDSNGLRLGDMGFAFDGDGARIHLTLYIADYSPEIRPSEPDLMGVQMKQKRSKG